MGGIAAPIEDVQSALNDKHLGAHLECTVHSVEKERVSLFFDGYAQGTGQVVEELSRQLKCPAFWFHVHDDDL